MSADTSTQEIKPTIDGRPLPFSIVEDPRQAAYAARRRALSVELERELREMREKAAIAQAEAAAAAAEAEPEPDDDDPDDEDDVDPCAEDGV